MEMDRLASVERYSKVLLNRCHLEIPIAPPPYSSRVDCKNENNEIAMLQLEPCCSDMPRHWAETKRCGLYLAPTRYPHRPRQEYEGPIKGPVSLTHRVCMQPKSPSCAFTAFPESLGSYMHNIMGSLPAASAQSAEVRPPIPPLHS